MANSGGIISGSVRQIADVKTVLGESVNTLSGLCKSTKINMWAKYKPVQFTGTRSSTWWKGRLNNCGISAYKLSSAADVVNHCNGTENGWSYERPNGSTYPYRLLDFQGYNHNATAPINSYTLGSATVTNKSGSKLSAWIAIRYNAAGDMLSLGDIDTVSSCYFGIYARRSGTTTGYQGYCTTTIGSEGNSLEVSTNGWTVGTYNVYPLLSSSSTVGATADFYSIPMMSPLVLSVIASSVDVGITTASYSGLNVSVVVTITNNTSASVTLSTNTWRTRPSSEAENDPETVYDQSGTIANQTVSAGASKTVSFTAKVTTDAKAEGAMIYVYFKNSTYKASRIIG